ncbi:TniQ family protein [Bacillus firmus]|uniref:TniQ family protein n=1 Tax=Cytobacillus firmus TaxID=1399 RepID=UPI0015810AD9|nr:TniQ family protein [Cytobacillus firmus]NUH86387.1 TniQ family protein [Cytobacillus firmus]
MSDLERSFLYNIKPIGYNSPFVESLTSLLNRIADAYLISPGTLFNEIFVPRLNKEYLKAIKSRGGNGFFDDSNGINGFGIYAKNLKSITEELTQNIDLVNTTLLLWEDVLPVRGLLRKKKAWCPVCYEEMKKGNRTIYDPLIWSIAESFVCTKHNIRYDFFCCRCKKEIVFLSRRGKPGYCPHCNHWLGYHKPLENLSAGVKDNHIRTSLLIEQMINFGFNSEAKELSKDKLVESLRRSISGTFDNNYTAAAKVTGIPKVTLMGWVNGKALPPLGSLSFLCINMGLKIEQMLTGEFDEKVIVYCQDSCYLKSTSKKIDHVVLKQYLINVINKREIRTLTDIAAKCGCDRKLLSRYFPEECRIIMNIYRADIEYKKKIRLENKLDKLKNVFAYMIEHEIYPSRRNIENVLGIGFLKEQTIKAEWKQLKDKLQ